MALATILKSHKSVRPIFVPVEGSTTSVAKKPRQKVDEVENKDEIQSRIQPQLRSKPRDERRKRRETSVTLKIKKITRKVAEEQIIPDSEKGKRTIFIGNVPPTCTKKKLVKMFCRFGKIESVRFRCARGSKMLPKRTIAKQGWTNTEQCDEMVAYIVFEREDDMMKSLEANGALLDDRHIRVDSVQGTSQHKHSHSVFVGNLPFTITNERLRDALQQCGEIEGTRVVRDKKTGCGKGFGFVLFKEKSGVMFALKQAKHIQIDGRKLRIFKSSENPQKQAKKRGKKKFQKDTSGSKPQKLIVKKKKFHNRQHKKSNKLYRKR